MRKIIQFIFFPLMTAISVGGVFAQAPNPRDEFYWMGQINKASAVINSQEGLLDKSLTPKVAAAIAKVIENGAKPTGTSSKRPSTYIALEPLLIEAADQDVTVLHAGRSSQDMFATFRAAMLKDDLLAVAVELNKVSQKLVTLAAEHVNTIVPNYTNGVAAQPNSYGHYLLGLAAGFDRDAQRLREAYARIDRSAMGATVLNGTSWPLNRVRMAEYLGFTTIVENAYDAGQISSVDEPVEVAGLLMSISLHIGAYIEDVMVQYAQPRPWILLETSKTYVSSAMPQKRNPGVLNTTRSAASNLIALAMAPILRAHNIPPGMEDGKNQKLNRAMLENAKTVVRDFNNILDGLVINPARALEELNSDWTASQELADVLMSQYKVPFRVGHHFASEVVNHAKTNDLKPADFPYAQAQRIYADAVKGSAYPQVFPLSETQFRATLNPTTIVNNRKTQGGPQPSEMKLMLASAQARVTNQSKWISDKTAQISAAQMRLDADFIALLKN
jgi:argininosuccinate lyase